MRSRFSRVMGVFHTFDEPTDPKRPEDSNVVTAIVPSNLAEIKEALMKERDDLFNK